MAAKNKLSLKLMSIQKISQIKISKIFLKRRNRHRSRSHLDPTLMKQTNFAKCCKTCPKRLRLVSLGMLSLLTGLKNGKHLLISTRTEIQMHHIQARLITRISSYPIIDLNRKTFTKTIIKMFK